MIRIDNFSVNNNNNALDVTVTTDIGETITSAILWTDATYKDYSKAIDLTTLLVQTSNMEAFSIPASTLGVTSLDGIYFIEFETSSEEEDDCDGCSNTLGVATSLLLFKSCLLNKILEYSPCETKQCNDNRCNIINISLFLEAVMISLEFGYYGEAIDRLKALRKLCNISNGNCNSCKDLVDPIFKKGLNYGTLNGTLILV